MSLPNTTTLDIPERGGPAYGIYSTSTGPILNTGTLDFPSRGGPGDFIYQTTSGAGATRRRIPGPAYFYLTRR